MDKLLLEKIVEAAWRNAKYEAEYMLENKIYPLGQFLVSKDSYNIKVGDGEHHYLDLPYINEGKVSNES